MKFGSLRKEYKVISVWESVVTSVQNVDSSVEFLIVFDAMPAQVRMPVSNFLKK